MKKFGMLLVALFCFTLVVGSEPAPAPKAKTEAPKTETKAPDTKAPPAPAAPEKKEEKK